MKLHLDSAKGYYSSRVGLNMYELTTGEYTVVFKLYFPSYKHLLTIRLLTYQPPVVLRQLQEHQQICLVITAEVERSCNTCPLI